MEKDQAIGTSPVVYPTNAFGSHTTFKDGEANAFQGARKSSWKAGLAVPPKNGFPSGDK
jgi:hypothetical protein